MNESITKILGALLRGGVVVEDREDMFLSEIHDKLVRHHEKKKAATSSGFEPKFQKFLTKLDFFPIEKIEITIFPKILIGVNLASFDKILSKIRERFCPHPPSFHHNIKFLGSKLAKNRQ